MTALETAKKLLSDDSTLTCVICREGEIFKSTLRGVRPLLELLDSGKNLKGAAAADKVVGKGAAFLYALLGVREVYATVLSESALAVLSENGIKTEFGALVPAIRNRAGDGFCPIETAVRNITCPQSALKEIRETLKKLK